MAVTQADIQAFNDYAQKRLSNGGVESIEMLFREWLNAREASELAEDIRQAELDFAAGRGQPLEEAIADIRKNLGWSA